MESLILGIFVFTAALVFALLEIEIEGKDGWARNLPTWYKKSGISKIFSKLSSGKPLTGYHLLMLIFILLIFHSGFFISMSWNAINEVKVLFAFVIFLIAEDFLWFVFNPYFGIKKFKKEKVWWHSNSKWIFNLFPADYIVWPIIILSALLVLSITIKYTSIFLSFLAASFYTFLLSVLSIFFVSFYKKWYFKLRALDESKLFRRKIKFKEAK